MTSLGPLVFGVLSQKLCVNSKIHGLFSIMDFGDPLESVRSREVRKITSVAQRRSNTHSISLWRPELLGCPVTAAFMLLSVAKASPLLQPAALTIQSLLPAPVPRPAFSGCRPAWTAGCYA